MNQPNKNNSIIVNGSSTEFANIELCVRRIYACSKVLAGISEAHPNYAEVSKKQSTAEFDLTATIETTFNQVWYPAYLREEKAVRLVLAKLNLRSAREAGKKPELKGEAAVEEALAAAGKLYLQVEGDEKVLDTLLVRATDVLWGTDTRLSWADLQARARENGPFPFLPPGGLEAIRKHALVKDTWRDREGKLLKGQGNRIWIWWTESGVAARAVFGFQRRGSASRPPDERFYRLLCRGHRPAAGQCSPQLA